MTWSVTDSFPAVLGAVAPAEIEWEAGQDPTAAWPISSTICGAP